jgi:hypothetical protein
MNDLDKTQKSVDGQRQEIVNRIDALIGELQTAKNNIVTEVSK